MTEKFDLERMEKFYPLMRKSQELKLGILHNYINHYTENEEEREKLYRDSFFYVLEDEANELDRFENLI